MVGPIYCETGHSLGIIAEPINFATNAFIILAAILAWRFVNQRASNMRADYVILLTLLFAVGFGSFWWHGFRTSAGLIADFVPGLLFLFTFVWLWARRLFSQKNTVFFLGGYLSAIALGGSVTPAVLPFFFSLFASSLVFGGFLVYRSFRIGGALGWLSFWTILSALAAAIFRSSDLAFCAYAPFGLHFLWHMCLSLAAYFAIRLLVTFDTRPTSV